MRTPAVMLLLITASAAAGCDTQATAADARAATAPSPRRVLRVCADPNNLPFTNERCEGFENRIADLLARELDLDLQYTWRAQRRGFFRAAFKEGDADLVLGVPAGFDRVLTTKPYYRSSYVLVSRKTNEPAITTLDDPRLRRMSIGVQLVGDDGWDTPPAHALASRGLARNAEGFTLYGDYHDANPPARIVDAVASGKIDVAAVWGPLAGYFATREPVALDVRPIEPQVDRGGIRFAFSIAMGVRKQDVALRDAIDAVLASHRSEIDAILADYGVPLLPLPAAPAVAAR